MLITHLRVVVGSKRPPELGSKRRLAHSALAAKNNNLPPHGVHSFAYEWQRRIGAFSGIRRAYLLVRASGACVCLAGKLGFCALRSTLVSEFVVDCHRLPGSVLAHPQEHLGKLAQATALRQ